ncbi:DUF4340 domain-containing protein [Pelagicoccus sp. SDUM812002]|uniref:DUF4340 domain-containing protein n=1 Tax=Pelagicoccus sp. SDUM812002 TaxID=3041266 RepID=UPI0028101C3B|nr:DUF4340 domain-containing protein [Pelagicoccus sp. SDUM812002]MDQ8186987.1 DUF4340 domain-containing protein [Pelagicoccus sp. SDUM812002]
MNLKKLYITTAVLAVAATVTYFVKNADTSKPEDPRIGTNLVDNDELNQVTELELISGTESMTFLYDADASNWQLQESYNLPADTGKITELTNQLKETKLQRIASRKPERIADFGFGIDYINLNDASGNSILSLDLGRETEAGKQLVRFGQEELAFIASDSFSVDGDPVSWLEKTLIDVERDAIRSATFQLENGDTLSVTREDDTTDWTTEDTLPEGKQLDQGAITRALNRLVSINFIRLAEQSDPEVVGAQDHSYTISYTLADDSSYTITAGQRPEVKVEKEVETTNEEGETVTEMQEEVETPAGAVFVQISSSDSDAAINEYMSRAAFATTSTLYTAAPKALDDLLSDIPEPEPEEEPAEDPEPAAE